MSEVQDFILKSVQMTPAIAKGPFGLLARHGRTWTPRPLPLPDDIRPGKLGHCFSTCQIIATRMGDYTYCEGYACGIIPTLHAWLADADGNAIDPTWCGAGDWLNWRTMRPPTGMEYFGIAIKTEYVIARLVGTETHCPIIDDWANGHPILKAPVRDWKHPLNRRAAA